jgi:hypothetical protein
LLKSDRRAKPTRATPNATIVRGCMVARQSISPDVSTMRDALLAESSKRDQDGGCVDVKQRC